MHLLPNQLPWYVAGPGIGLLLVAMYAIGNVHLGISSTYLRTAQAVVLRRVPAEAWKVRYFIGLLLGALLAAFLRGGPTLRPGYEPLLAVVPLALAPIVLFLGGVLMGYGGRWAGGCTSGHGISGSAALSVGSIVATMTFMGVAIALTFALHFLTGGAL
jgi:uncharacterized membrane protein YedE/YeeE